MMRLLVCFALSFTVLFGVANRFAPAADEELELFCLKFQKNQKMECVLTEETAYRSIFVTDGAEIVPNPMLQTRIMELDIEVKEVEEKAAPATIHLHYKNDKYVTKNSSGVESETELPTKGRTIEIKKGVDEPRFVDGLGESQANRGCIARFEKIFGWADAAIGGRMLETDGSWELKDEQAKYIYKLTVGRKSMLADEKDLSLKSKASFAVAQNGLGTITLELNAEAEDTTVGNEAGESKAVKWSYSFVLTLNVNIADQTFLGIDSKAVTRWEPEQLNPANTKIIEETETIQSEFTQR